MSAWRNLRQIAPLWILVPILAACGDRANESTGQDPIFLDATARTGIDFVHFNGMSGQLYFSEVVGAGVALFDYDNDGDLDMFLGQGNMLGPDRTLDDATFAPQGPLSDRLYRNDLLTRPDGAVEPHFTDVTEASGLVADGYAMGVATGDFNNDGWVDLYLANFGPNQFWRNNGDGTFTDITEQTGTGDGRWATSATFFDADKDGLLDLYVANYVDYLADGPTPCRNSTLRIPDYCGPKAMPPETDLFYQNLGDGHFEDRTAAAGIREAPGSGLGVFAADLNDNGYMDVYVANDQRPNNLWINLDGKRFDDQGMNAGAAVNIAGYAESSMGIVADDFDGDGDVDLFMTHLDTETNTLYVNAGNGMFLDESSRSGLAEGSLPFTGFGTVTLDYDNDGWVDIMVNNGAVTTIAELYENAVAHPLGQTNQLFRNLGQGRFEEVTGIAGPVFEHSEVGRGAAAGDLDNDGDTDIVITNNSGPAQILLNEDANKNGWLGLRLIAGASDAMGAIARLTLDDGRVLVRRVQTDGSYLSASDPRILFGLGTAQPVELEILWPDDNSSTLTPPPVGEYTTLRKSEL